MWFLVDSSGPPMRALGHLSALDGHHFSDFAGVCTTSGVRQRNRFCDAPSGRVAYLVMGQGPFVMCDTGWVSHLEHMLEIEPMAVFRPQVLSSGAHAAVGKTVLLPALTSADRLSSDSAKLGGMDRSYVADNARELERMRALISKLNDQELGSMVNEDWTVAGVLGHVAFWDGCALYLAKKLRRDGVLTPADAGPEDVDWINDSARPLIHAIPPRQAAEVALSIAEETDELVASLSTELVGKVDPDGPLNLVRSDHRGAHLDEIEAALGGTNHHLRSEVQ